MNKTIRERIAGLQDILKVYESLEIYSRNKNKRGLKKPLLDLYNKTVKAFQEEKNIHYKALLSLLADDLNTAICNIERKDLFDLKLEVMKYGNNWNRIRIRI